MPAFPVDGFLLVKPLDQTAGFDFDASLITTGTTRHLTVQDSDGTLALLNLAQSWTAPQAFGSTSTMIGTNVGDKPLIINYDISFASPHDLIWAVDGSTGFHISLAAEGATANRTISLPDGSGTLAMIDFSQPWIALQRFRDDSWKIIGVADATKTVMFSVAGATTGADLTLIWAGTADRSITFPNATTTLAGLAVAETWTGVQTFGPGTAVFGTGVDDEVLPLFRTRINVATSANEFLRVDDIIGSGFTGTLTIPSGGFTANRSWTMPDATGTLVTTSNTATFQNKTLSTGTIMSVDFTLNSGVDMILNTGTGTMIGTAVGQKLAFHGSAAVIQRAGAAQVAVATTAATQTTPWGFTTAAQADGIITLLNEIRAALVEKGIVKGAA